MTNAKKAAQGELSSRCCVSPAVYDAMLFACIGKRKGWVYEEVDESGLSSKYWAAPIESSTLFISGGERSAAVLAEAPKNRPLLMMSEQGVHCCCLFTFCPCVQTHRTLLPPDDEAKSQDVEESKSEAIAASISTSLPIAASIITPAPKRLRPLSEDWEAHKAWLRAGRPRHEQQQAPTKKKPATTKKKPALRQKKEFWEEYDPALDKASKYWDVEVEGQRTRTLSKPSYIWGR